MLMHVCNFRPTFQGTVISQQDQPQHSQQKAGESKLTIKKAGECFETFFRFIPEKIILETS